MKNKRGLTLLELAVVLAIVAVLAAVILPAVQQINNRTLYNTSLQLQADLRYVQQRTIREGRVYGIIFEPNQRRYRIVYFLSTPVTNQTSTRNVRIVNLPRGVYLDHVTYTGRGTHRIWFHPRGTPSGGFRVILRYGDNVRHTTVSVSGGRAYVWPLNQSITDYNHP